jgi:hypothetical protein
LNHPGGILRNILRFIFLFCAILLTSVLFQNCSQKQSFISLIPNISSKASGNGGGYDGKLEGSYYHYIPNYTCEGKKSYKDKIVISENKIYLYENQVDVCAKTPREIRIDEITTSAFENEFIIAKNNIFAHSELDSTGIPENLTDVVCREDSVLPTYEVVTQYNKVKNISSTRVYFLNTSKNIERFEDTNTLRLLSIEKAEFSAFQGGLKFKVYLDHKAGEIISTNEIWNDRIKTKKMICTNGSNLESRLKFTGSSELTKPVSTRIISELSGPWTFIGECDPSLGDVTIKGEAFDSPTVTMCQGNGSFSQTIDYSQFKIAKYSPFGLPQVIATQGSSIAMTRIYKIPSAAQILYISTPQELQNISINGSGADYMRAIILTNDIDLLPQATGTSNFTRLASGSTANNRFYSSFFGDGHKLKNLTIGLNSTGSYTSLLGYVSAGVITDLHLRDVKINSTELYVGAVAGYLRTCTVIRVSVTGDVASTNGIVGGIAGYGWDPEISESWFSGNVSGSNYVGGIIGQLWDNFVINSWSDGNVTATNSTGGAGGVIGFLQIGSAGSHVENSYSVSSINGQDQVGGLIGLIPFNANILSETKNSFSAGQVKLESKNPTGNEFAGPVVGINGQYSFGNYQANTDSILTNLFSLNTADCLNCHPISMGYGSAKTWSEINNFTQSSWNFVDVWKIPLDPTTSPPILRFNPTE